MDDYTLPECSPEFLRVLKNIFDTRRMLRYKEGVSLEYLKGIQEVLDYIEINNNNDHDKYEEYN